MAFKPGKDNKVDLSALKQVLLSSPIHTKDNPLFQVIVQLIDRVAQNEGLNSDGIAQNEGNIALILLRTFLTVDDEVALLPNSRQLLAGTGITFDDSVPGERTVSSSGGGLSFVPLATGAEPLEIMSDGAGRVLLVAFNE